jgi:hypothetical protein
MILASTKLKNQLIALNGSIKPPGGENGRDGEASTLLAEGGWGICRNMIKIGFSNSLTLELLAIVFWLAVEPDNVKTLMGRLQPALCSNSMFISVLSFADVNFLKCFFKALGPP